MDTKKFLTGTLVGGLAFFIIGFLIYGVALMSFMSAHSGSATGVQKTELEWWALVLGNLASAALLTYIFIKWANVSSFGGGASAAAMIGLLTAASFDLIMFATSNVMDLTAAFVDVIAATIMYSLAGGIIGVVLGMGKKA